MSKFFKVLISIAALSLFVIASAVTVSAEGGLTGIITGDQVNVRETPSFNAQVVTRLASGTEVNVGELVDGWYQVSTTEMTGWVSGQFLTVGNSTGIAAIVVGDNVNIRTGAGTWADVLTRANAGDKVTIVGRSEDWLNVQLADGNTGWVRKDFVSIGASRGDETALQIISYAKKFLGVGYVYGGSSPNGFDCSGFTKYVLGNFGISLQRVAADQASQGVKVGRADLRAGDLVFFATSGGSYISHVGIYIGNGSFIHASSGSAHCVTISSISDYYANTYVTARRIVR